MRVVLLEEFPEIGEPVGLGITRNYLLRFFLPKVHVAQGHNLAEPGFLEIPDDLGSPVGDAHAGQPDLIGLFALVLGAGFQGRCSLHPQDDPGCSQAGRLHKMTS